MKVVFISNFLNHHQEPLANAFQETSGTEFYFIATGKIPEERKKLGYHEYSQDKYSYLLSYEMQKDACNKLVYDADIVIIGSAPYIILKDRLAANKLTYVYTERIFKNKKRVLKTMISGRWYSLYKKMSNYKSTYVLCASAYAAHDFKIINAFKNRCFAWGYFPERSKTNFDELVIKKKNNSEIKLLWVGRLLDWKNPEHAVFVAKELKNRGYNFCLDIIGIGPEEEKIKSMIEKYNLNSVCKMRGSMPPEEVRMYMEKADIFLFNSDYNEGWGAVLNESMGSGCCVLANYRAGATNFLVKNLYNGLIYSQKEDLVKMTAELIDNDQMLREYQLRAYETITYEWNENVAVKRLLEISKGIIDNKLIGTVYEQGPMSNQ